MRINVALASLAAWGLLVTACSTPPSYEHRGVVVDVDGRPLAGATVEADGSQVRTESDGSYVLTSSDRLTWVTVESSGHLSRTRASSPEGPVLVRLSKRAADTVSIHFAGDTMAGRRFYDRDEDGDPADGQLNADPTVHDHLELLEDIQPLLAEADLTVVNLETPLTEDPWYDVNGPRPTSFHPTKDYAFSSDPRLADALAAAGVDVVDIGNNHLYDRLDAGVVNTIVELDEAGLAHYGAGRTVEEAWRPAFVERKGETFAFIGCTTITGEEHRIRYVAGSGQGGAAACDPTSLSDAVRAASKQADAVIVSIHGGFEYGSEPSDQVARLTDVAREAGARLVVNHHPHVVGGLDVVDSTVIAENMGNFLFDQTIWQTFPGAMFRAELRDGHVVRALAEPIVLADYRPRGLVGAGTSYVQRVLTGLGGDEAVMEDGAVELDLRGERRTRERTVEIDGTHDLYRLAPGVVVTSVTGAGAVGGRDILRVGSFEDHQVGGDDSHWSYWELQPGREVGPDLGRRQSAGARISRDAGDEEDAFFNPRHRILVEGGSDVTFTGWVRSDRSTKVSAQLSWYPDTKGPSSSQTVESVDVDSSGDDGWRLFRVDATAPADAVAVGAFVRLSPPDDGSVQLRIDDLAVIQWDERGTAVGARYDHLRIVGAATVTSESRYLPGGAAWARRSLSADILDPIG